MALQSTIADEIITKLAHKPGSTVMQQKKKAKVNGSVSVAKAVSSWLMMKQRDSTRRVTSQGI